MSDGNTVDLVIKGGWVVTPAGIAKQWIAVDDGVIVAMGTSENQIPVAKRTIDATGKHVIPGVIDNEHHPNVNPPEELVQSETRASIAAGITTVGIEYASTPFARPKIEFPKPEEVPLFMSVLPNVRGWEANKDIWTDYFFTPWMTNDAQAKEIPELAKEHGVTSYKLYLHCRGGEHAWDMWGVMKYLGAYYFDDGMVYTMMKNIAALGPSAILGMHCENWGIARVLKDELMAQGRTDPEAWNDHSPGFTEAGDVRTYSYYAKVTGCPILVRHVTAPETFQAVKNAKAEGVNIRGNTSQHYLTIPSIWRTNVPFRPAETWPLMWEALRDGVIDTVSSDCVYRAMPLEMIEDIEKKTGPISEVGIRYPYDIFEGPSKSSIGGVKTRDGISGRQEALLPLMLSEGVNKGRLSMERLVQVMSENSARIFGIYPKKGIIAVGSDADIVLVDLEKTKKLSRDQIFGINGWSLWEGWEVKGWPVMTILRGDVLMEWPDGEPRPRIIGNPGGKYLPRKVG